jgi:ribosome biogenesis GTPase / thiamine phosphate phosphatase
LAPYLSTGQTVALLGSSGVGKSTLINQLAGQELLRVQAVRQQDDRGRHTTARRELIFLPRGGLVLDTPGMRELQLWENVDWMQLAFNEIEALAGHCYFRDCQHQREPRCAVLEALEEGTIDLARYRHYEKLQRELNYLALRQDSRAQSTEKKKWKKLCQLAKRRSATKRAGDY